MATIQVAEQLEAEQRLLDAQAVVCCCVCFVCSVFFCVSPVAFCLLFVVCVFVGGGPRRLKLMSVSFFVVLCLLSLVCFLLFFWFGSISF